MKFALSKTQRVIEQVTGQEDSAKAKEESNANTLVLPNGSSCWIFPVTPTSKPESKSLDLEIFEESQDLDDKIIKEQIWPMGATTNAPRIYIGTAGTRLCYFRNLGMSPDALKLYADEISAQRRKMYERTGDASHLIYEQYVASEVEKHGLDSDEVQRPYYGKWLIGTGQFMTEAELMAMETTRSLTFHEKENECYAGFDVAKHPDSTVVTIIRFNRKTQQKELINWLELRGENYQSQFEIVCDFLSNYNVIAIAVDATGVGDPIADMFRMNTEWADEKSGLYAVKFSSVSKDNMYKNLKITIKELLTTLPRLDTKKTDKFRQQMLDLQQEYKGQLLSVNHPDDPNAHDDYPDSWALAEWAFAKYNEDNNASISIVTTARERNPDKELPDDYTTPGWE